MYGLNFREELPQRVADEFDGLVAALRGVFYREHNEDGTHVDAAPEFALVPVGSVQGWLTNTPPDRWLICDGSPISRITYNPLFKVLGISYGAGDGVLTFNLPDLRGRFFLGKAAAGTGSTLGAVGGSIDHTHAGPSHTHAGPDHTHGITSGGAHTHTGSTGSEGSHSHSIATVTSGGSGDQHFVVEDGSSGDLDVSLRPHVHNYDDGTTGSAAAHTHSISSDGAHDHGAVTGSGGTGNTGSGGTGNTGASNPPFMVANYIVFAGGVA